MLLFGLTGCFRTAERPLPRLGKVPLAQLCTDIDRCDVRGDVAINTLKSKKAAPIFLAESQGPQHYLGKVAPQRKVNGALKTCASEVTKDDWLSSGTTVHEFDLPNDGRQQLRSALRAYLAGALLDRNDELSGGELDVAATVDAAASGVNLKRMSMISQTFWLKDIAFERRVGQCGEEEYTDIIYSLTLFELSELTRKELEAKLLDGLTMKVAEALPAPEPSPSGVALLEELGPSTSTAKDAGATPSTPAQRRAILREVAHDAVRSLSNELRMIAALGFDEP